SQAFEIVCPVCRSVVPLDAPSCPNCARNRAGGAATEVAATTATAPKVQAPEAAASTIDLRTLKMKDYHRVVRATYNATERPVTLGSRARAVLPFVLFVLLLLAGAAVIFGHMP